MYLDKIRSKNRRSLLQVKNKQQKCSHCLDMYTASGVPRTSGSSTIESDATVDVSGNGSSGRVVNGGVLCFSGGGGRSKWCVMTGRFGFLAGNDGHDGNDIDRRPVAAFAVVLFAFTTMFCTPCVALTHADTDGSLDDSLGCRADL